MGFPRIMYPKKSKKNKQTKKTNKKNKKTALSRGWRRLLEAAGGVENPTPE